MAAIKLKLNSSRSPDKRYYLLKNGKGMAGDGYPEYHYLNNYIVENGVRAMKSGKYHGYAGYTAMSVDCAISAESGLPDIAKQAIRQALSI